MIDATTTTQYVEYLSYKLLMPFQLTAELQDFIMFLGLSALIILLIEKVYYLFFYRAVRL